WSVTESWPCRFASSSTSPPKSRVCLTVLRRRDSAPSSMSDTGTPQSLNWKDVLRYGAEALPFYLFMGLFQLLGIEVASATGGFIGRYIFYRVIPTADRARKNLKAAYPDMPQAEIEAIIREMFDNLGRTVAEYPHLDKLKLTGPNPRLEITGKE